MDSAGAKNFIDVMDTIKIVILALCTNLFAEFLTWLFIYRTKKIQRKQKANGPFE